MKAIWKKSMGMAMGIFAAATLAAASAEAAEQGKPDYFGEFRVPLQMAADPMYQRLRFVQFAEYVAYNSAFNILPNEMMLMVQHEYPILAYYMEHGRYQ